MRRSKSREWIGVIQFGSKMYKFVILILSFSLSLSNPAYSRIDASWLGHVFVVSDPEIVTVELYNFKDPSRRITLNMPKSALVFSAQHFPENEPTWPDWLEDHAISYAVLPPADATIGEVLSRSKSERDSISVLRTKAIKVELLLLPLEFSPEKMYAPIYKPVIPTQRAVTGVATDGLRYSFLLSGSTGNEKVDELLRSKSANARMAFFGVRGEDEFDVADCHDNPKAASVLCTYYLTLPSNLLLRVTFSDFRFHEGRAFINDQMRVALRALCKFDPSCGRADNQKGQ